MGTLRSHCSGIVIGDLRSAAETRSITEQVNAIGRMDAVIHNAGVYTERSRGSALAIWCSSPDDATGPQTAASHYKSGV